MNNPNKLSASEREFLLSELEKNNNSFELEETKEIDKHFIFLLDELSELLFIINNSGKIVFVNNRITNYGYSKLELKGKFVFELFHRETKNLLEYFFNKSNMNKLWIFKDDFVGKNGVKFPFEFKIKSILRNGIPFFVLIGRDLSEIVNYQKEIENLKNEKTIEQKAIQKSDIGIWQWDIVTGEIRYDDMYKILLEYKEDPFQGSFQKFIELINEEDRKKVVDDIKEHFFERKEKYSSFYRIKNAKGQYVWFFSRGVVVDRDKFGIPKYMIGIYTETDEYEEKFKEILEGKNYLRKIIENMDQGLVVLDKDLKLKLANKVFYSSLNMPENVVYFKDILDAEYESVFDEKIQELKDKKEGTVSFECRLINKKKEYIYAFITALSYDENSQEIILIITDITQKKKLEDLLRKYATIDDLTDTYNRRAGFLALERALQSAKKKKEPMSVVFVDVDNLKTINDNFGHDVGDFVLRKVAAVIKDSIRENDILIRVGGDEFVLGLPGAKREDAEKILQRIVEALNNVELGGGLKVDLSYGICEYDEFEKDLDLEYLVKLADNGMYEMKKRKNKPSNRSSEHN
ncbi:MAG TPA: diguanylate cyclase [Defluviitoga sp.]|nr:diguanylate cyclase [Defluviitoga sp.]HOP25121.1 diguanylate cyclase [Defluviitoga sp.]HPZ28819.1 diguanylate cyclase [Defluviitoga sp.]HQD62838.1 diguanylate cyclase [Defluviitoga sp.]